MRTGKVMTAKNIVDDRRRVPYFFAPRRSHAAQAKTALRCAHGRSRQIVIGARSRRQRSVGSTAVMGPGIWRFESFLLHNLWSGGGMVNALGLLIPTSQRSGTPQKT